MLLNSQIEEMRKAAAMYRMLGRYELSNVLLEAVESITELSVHLQCANDENAKLKELVRELWEYIYIGTAQDEQSLHDRTRELGIEIAKSWETEDWQLV